MKKFYVSLVCLISFLVFSFISCNAEIGLGSAVDTKAPEISITGPSAGVIIRDAFAIYGECSDDGTIDKLTVTLKPTDENSDFGEKTLNGTFNQQAGTWNCVVDPTDENSAIPDGTYEATIEITDRAGRSTIKSRQFTIDNTAPVLAITRPSAVFPENEDPETSTDYDSYGQDLLIEGYVADTCERRYLSVEIYDLSGNLVYSSIDDETDSNKQRIKIDASFSTTIASFGDNAYNKIYGNSLNGTKKYACALTAYDNAKKYPTDGSAQTEADEIGNASTYFYMYEGDLYDTFSEYGMTNIYKILNGSYSETDANAIKVDYEAAADVKKDLCRNANQVTKGFLSLNPANNPYFKISGHDPLEDVTEDSEYDSVFDNKNHQITSGAVIVAEIYPGLDQTPLLSNTLGLYVQKCNEEGKIDSATEKIYLIKPASGYANKEEKSLELTAEETAARTNALSKSGSTYKITIAITVDDVNLISGENYIFGIDGYDRKGINVKNTAENTYGFRLVVSQTAPVLTITGITPEWITTNTENVTETAEKKFSISMNFDGAYSSFSLIRTAKDSDGNAVGEAVEYSSIKDKEFTDEYVPVKGENSGTLVYTLSAGHNLSSTKEINYKIDNDYPEIAAEELKLPTIYDTESSVYKFKGAAKDEASGISQVQMKISDSENAAAATDWVKVGEASSWIYTVDFQNDEDFKSAFVDENGKILEGEKTVVLRAIDVAGNIGEEYSASFVYDTADPVISVDSFIQKGEKPVSFDGSNEFSVSKEFSLTGSASDGYGIKEIKIIQKKDNDEPVVIATLSENDITSGVWSLEKLPRKTKDAEGNLLTDCDEADVANGTYQYTVTVTDKTGEKSKTTQTFTATIDLDAPVITITSPSTVINETFDENADNTISGTSCRFDGTVTDVGTGTATYSYIFTTSAETPAEDADWHTVDYSSSNWNFYMELEDGTGTYGDAPSVLCEGKWYLHVKAIDKAGNNSEVVSRAFIVDQSSPVLNVVVNTDENCLQSDNSVYYYDGTLTGLISYYDSFGLNAENPVTFKLGSADVTDKVTVSDETDENGNFIWSFTSSENTDAEKRFSITVKDKVGKTTVKSYEIYKDTLAPVVAISYPKEGSSIGESKFTASGSSSDGDGVGIAYLEYSTDAENWTRISYSGNTTWNQQLDYSSKDEGNTQLYVKAVDSLGKESVSAPVNFFFDKQNPQITLNADETEYINAATASYTISGTAFDTNSLAGITIIDGDKTYSSADGDISISGIDSAKSEATAAVWNFAVPVDELTEGSHSFKISAYDKAERNSVALTKELYVDKEAPVIKTIAVPTPKQTEDSYFNFSGTAADGGNASLASGLSKVEVKLSNGTDSTEWIDATGTSRWSNLVNYENETYSAIFASEGIKTISVRAADAAGNLGEINTQSFVYDKADPAASIASYKTAALENTLNGEKSFDVNSEFSISAAVSDSYALSRVELIQKTVTADKEISAVIATKNFNDKTTAATWTVNNLPRAADSTGEDGISDTETTAQYRYYVVAYDASSENGKQTQSETVSVRIDKIAPEVTITKPSANLGKENSLSGANYTFEGTAIDNSNGVGLDQYFYAFTATDEEPAEWSAATTESNAWTIKKDLISGTDGDSASGLSEGQWYLWVKAADKASNESEPQKLSFWVDLSAPELGSAITTGDNCKLVSGIYYTNSALTGTVSAIDTYGIEAVTCSINGAAAVEVAGSQWTIPLTSLEEGKSSTIVFTATDFVGKTATNTYTVIKDTTAPSITLSASSQSSMANLSSLPLAIVGSISDGTGIGASKIYYSLDGSEPSTEISFSGTTWNLELNDVLFTSEGEYDLKLKAEDSFGQISDVSATHFYYDRAQPEVSETDAVSANQKYGYDFALSGTAGDSNAVDYITITDGTDIYGSTDESDSSGTARIAVTTGKVKLSEDNGNKEVENGKFWTLNFKGETDTQTAVNPLSEGKHTFKIVSKDIAGKASASVEKSITIDTVAPTVENTKMSETIYLDVSTMKSLTATAVDSGVSSGLAGVYYLISDSASAPAFSNETWTELGKNSTAYTTKYDVTDYISQDGTIYAWIAAADNCGNITVCNNPTVITVDKSVPEVKLFKDSDLNTEVTDTTILSNTETITLYAAVYDSNAAENGGLEILTGTAEIGASETIYDSDGTTVAGKKYILAFECTDTGAKLEIQGKDENGRISKTAGITGKCDLIRPVISDISTNTDANNCRKYDTLKITGTVKEPNLEEVKVRLYAGGELKYEETAGTKTLNAAEGTSTFTVNFSGMEDGSYTARIDAGDTYGNNTDGSDGKASSTVVINTIIIDTTAPSSSLAIGSGKLYNQTGEEVSVITDGGTYYTKSAYTLTGTITEANYESAKVTITTKDNLNATVSNPTFTADESKVWSLNGIEADGCYKYEIRIEDKATNASSVNVTLWYDTTAPETGIFTPDDGTYFPSMGKVTIQGNLSEDGIGVGKLLYRTRSYDSENNTWSSYSDEEWSTTNPNGWKDITTSISGTTFSFEYENTAEGKLAYEIKATDYLGNETIPSESDERTFSCDLYNPSLTVIAPKSPANGTVTISGTAYDTNLLKKVEISVGESTYSSEDGAVTMGNRFSAKSDATKITWNKDFVTGEANKTAENYLADGTYNFTITAYDDVNKTKQQYAEVIIDTKSPVITPDEIAESDSYIKASNYEFSGTVSDESPSSGVSTVTLQLYDQDNSAASPAYAAKGTAVTATVLNDGSWKSTFYNLEDGHSYKVMAAAADKAGNTSTTKDSTSVTVDRTAPVSTLKGSGLTDTNAEQATELTSGETYYAKAGYSFSGKVTELHAPAATVKVDGEDKGSVAINSDGEWTYDTLSGSHTYSFTFSDVVGNNSTYTAEVKADSTAPSVTIGKPGTDIAGTAAISGESYQFGGTLSDADGVGPEYIEYIFTQDNAVADGAVWTKLKTSGTWSISRTLTSGTSSGDGSLYEGKWNLFVRGGDKAGNVSGTVVRSFWIDQDNPEISVTNIPSSGTYYYRTQKLAVTGTASDSQGMDYIKIAGGTSEVTVRIADAASGDIDASGVWSWTAEIEVEADKEKEITATAYDKAGKSTAESRTVYRDTNAPVLTYRTPAADNYAVTALPFEVNGTVKDGNGAGVAKVMYSVGGSEYREATVDNGNWSFSLTDSMITAEGYRTISIYGIDAVGNEGSSAALERTIIYDNSIPEITGVSYKAGSNEAVVTADKGTKIVKANGYTLSGNFADTGTKVKVTVKRDGSDCTVTQNAGKSGTWSVTEADLADGSHTYIVTAEDEAGQSSTYQTTLTTDITEPEISLKALPDRSATKQSMMTLSGNVSDATTGVAGAKITIADVNNAALTKTAAVEVTSSGWTTAVTFADFGTVFSTEGKKKITLEAADNAGNSITVDAGSFNYDKADPEVELNSASFNKYMTEAGLTLTGTASDTNELKSLTVYQTGAATANKTVTVDSDGNWSVKVPLNDATPANGEKYAYEFVAEDAVGNKVYSTNYSTTVDTEGPEVVISKPLSTNTGTSAINSAAYTISGTASDANGVEAVWYQLLASSGTPTAAPSSNILSDSSWSNWTKMTGEANWSSDIVFKNKGTEGTGRPEGSYVIYVYAVDNAGNLSAQYSRAFDVDMAVPVLSEEHSTSFRMNDGFTLKGSLVETNLSTFAIYEGDTKFSDLTRDEGTTTWSKTFGKSDLTDGIHVFTITAEDAVGKKESITRTVTYDTQAPEIGEITASALVTLDSSLFWPVSAAVADNVKAGGTSATGVQNVYYQILGPSGTAKTEADLSDDGWTIMSLSSEKYTATLNYTGKGEGKYYIFIKAIDVAGNTAVSATPTVITVDKSIPEVKLFKDSDLNTEVTDTTILSNTKTITLYAAVYDSNVAGTGGLEIVTGTAETGTAETIYDSDGTTVAGKKYKLTFEGTDSGAKLEIQGKDENGRTSRTVSVTGQCDLERPELSGVTANTDANNCRKYDTLKITGTVKEPNLEEVKVRLYAGGELKYEETAGTKTLNAAEGTSTFTVNFSGMEDGSYTARIDAGDTYGNNTDGSDGKASSTFVINTIIIDTTAPVMGTITADPASINIATSGSGNLTIKAEITDGTSGVTADTVKLYDNNVLVNTTAVYSSNLCTFSIAKSSVTTGTHTYKIGAVDLAGNSSEGTVAVRSDITAPEIAITGITPTVTVNEDEKVNGKITVSGTFTDETGINNTVSWKVYDSSDTELTGEGTSGTATVSGSGVWSFQIDTTKLTSTSGQFKIKVTGKDTAANESTAEKAVSVDQSSDKPVISLTNASTTISAFNEISDGQTNVFTKGGLLIASITDDDGVGSVKVTVTPENGEAQVYNQTVSSTHPANYSLSYTLPNVEGAYTIKIDVADSKNETESDAAAATVYIAVDSSAPAFSGMTANNGYYKDSVAVSGNVADGSGTIKLVKSAGNGTSSAYASAITVNSTSAAISDTLDISASSVSEGSNEVTYTATDRWGKTATYTITYNKDSTAPAISTETGKAPALSRNKINIANKTTVVSANVSDGTGCGIEKVFYTIGSDTTENEMTLSSGTEYKATIDFSSDESQGEKTIKIYAKDILGNVTAAGDAPVLSLSKDTVAPVSTLTNIAGCFDDSGDSVSAIEWNGNYYINKGFTLSGKITETNFASAVLKVNGTEKAFASGGNAAGDWTYVQAKADGKYEYSLTVTDSYGNEKSYALTVTIDVSAPANVQITSPASDKTGTNAISDSNIIFKGKAADVSGGTGVAKVFYLFDKTEAASATMGDYTAITVADSEEWSVAKETVAGSASTMTANQLNEGKWYLHVMAQDIAGNISAAVTRTVEIDKANPALETAGSLKENGKTNAIRSEVTTVNEVTGYTFSGTVSDTNAMAEENPVTVLVDGEAVAATVNGSSWNCTIPTGAANGKLKSDELVEVVITATDTTGKTTQKDYILYYDTQKPDLDVSAPAADESVETNSKTIKGTVSDEGFGLKSLQFELRKHGTTNVVTDENGKDISGSITYDSTGTATTAGNYPLTIKGESWYYPGSGSTPASIPLGGTEGTLDLWVCAKENTATPDSDYTASTVVFYYDANDPNVTETGIGTAGLTTNSSFTFTGTAYDTNALSKIEIKDDSASAIVATTGTLEEGQVAIAFEESTTLEAAKSDETKAKWQVTIPASSVTDGTHVYKVIATDISGKTKEVSRTVTVDSVAPAVETITVTPVYTDSDSKKWFNSKSIAVSVTASDKNGTGVTAVEYTTDAPSADTRSWNALANTGSAFEGNVNFGTNAADGVHTFYVRAKDVAGNYTATENQPSQTVYLDTKAPADAVLITVDGAALSGDKLTNKSADITFVFTVADTTAATGDSTGIDETTGKIPYVSRIGSTSKSIVSTATVNAGEYTITIPKADVLSGGVYVKAQDKVGNEKEVMLFQVKVDETYPSTVINAVTDADSDAEGTQINQTFKISGTASDDNNVLTSLKLQYTTTAPTVADKTVTWPDGTTWKDYGTEKTSSIGNWSYEIDTLEVDSDSNLIFQDDTTYYFRAIATDKAGNTGNSGNSTAQYAAGKYAAVIVSQDSDRPVVRLNNLELASTNKNDNDRYWHKEKTLYGTVSDDDGVSSIKYKTSAAADWSENILANGMWTISNLEDGEVNLYFQVTDTNSTVFTSNDASTTAGNYGPKIIDKTGNNKIGYAGSVNDIILITVDNTAPSFATPKAYVDSSSTIDTSKFSGKTISDYDAVGGTNRYLYLKLLPEDSSGIKETVIKYNGVSATDTADTADAINPVQLISVTGDTAVYARIDLSKNAETDANKRNKVQIEVFDKANKSKDETYNLNLDNNAPVITYTTKTSNTFFGSISNNLQGRTEDDSEVTGLYYTITSASTAPAKADYVRVAYDDGVESDNLVSILNWNLIMDGGTTTQTDFHSRSLYAWYRDLNNKTDAELANDDATKTLYLWTYATDDLGNESTPEALELKVLLNGDKPSVEIVYPTDGASTGGIIRVSGTATVATDSVSAVYIQIDPTYDGSTFSSIWKTELEELMTSKSIPSTYYNIVDTEKSGDYQYGIKVNGTSGWNKTINDYSEFSTAGSKIAIRAFAVSTTNSKLSDAATCAVSIDPDSPLIGNKDPLELVQYENGASSGNVVARQIYKDDMYITGQWYLVGSIEDDSGIYSAIITYADGSTDTIVEKGAVASGKSAYVEEDTDNVPATVTTNKNFKINIPVGSNTTDDFGTLKYKISITDCTEQHSPAIANLTLNYDNKAPELAVTNSSCGQYSTDSTAEFHKIYQNNGTYTLNGTFDEKGKTVGTTGYNQSGFSRVVMYYTRTLTVTNDDDTTTSTTYLIDPMVSNGSDGKANRENVTGLTLDMTGDAAVKGIYWRTATGTVSNNILTVSKIGDDGVTSIPNTIRAGGLVKINDVIYRIKYISGTSVTIDGSLSNITTDTKVYFAAGALVVDNTTTESGTTSVYVPANSTADGKDNMTNGDGDQMIEGATKNGTQYSWTASIDSTQILDGDVTVHIVAFDQAGNRAGTSFDAKVKNNAPRLAGVLYGTDNNGNSEVEDDEILRTSANLYVNVVQTSNASGTTANGKYADGTNVDSITIASPLTVKGDLKVIPQIVGGNTGLGWKWSCTDADNKAYTSELTDYGVSHSADGTIRNLAGLTAEQLADKYADNGKYDIDISTLNFLQVNSNKGIKSGNQNLTFTIEDQTEGGSLSATVILPVNMVLADKEAPEATFNPFYWTSETANSLYGNSRDNGHIELEADWKSGSGYDNNTSGQKDDDPKVSGKITMDGVATDNVMVKTLTAKINGTDYTIATRGSDGDWSSSATMADNDWQFELVSDEFDSATGINTVTFKFHWNTAKLISTVAAKDVPVTITATDRGSVTLNTAKTGIEYSAGLSSTPGTTQTAADAKTGYYRMDVVPYVTEIITNLSSLDSTHRTAYSRTALGYYPVAEDETVKVNGFNLGDSSVTANKPTVKLGTNELDCGTAALTSIAGVEISTYSSGTLSVTVNGIENLNGSNKAAAEYNIIDNGANNDSLNDDVNLKVWQFKTIAEPISVEHIMYPTVKMSPADGKIGASYSNSYYFHMPGYGNNSSTTSYSHTPFLCGYDGADANSFTFDKNGYAYGGVQYRASDLPSEGGSFNFVFSTAKPESDLSLADVYRCNTGSARLENNCTNLRTSPTTDKTEWSYNKWRVKSPQFVAVDNSTDGDSSKVTVYAAYYDSTTKQIRYRKGVVDAKDLVGNNSGFTDNNGDHHGIGDTYMMKGENDSLKDIWHVSDRETTGGYADNIKAYPGFTSDASQGGAWDSNRNSNFGTRHVNAPDSLQTTNNQIIHVLASNGLTVEEKEWSETITTGGGVVYAKWYNESASPTTYYTKVYPPEAWNVYAYQNSSDFSGRADRITEVSGDSIKVEVNGDWNNQIYYTKAEVKEEGGTETVVNHSTAIQGIYKKTDSANNHTYANGAGEYVALGVLSKGDNAGKAVIAWYDNSTKHLLIAKEPTFTGDALNANAGTDFANSYARTTAWEGATIDLGSGGEYVQLVVDSDDNIHIAHYDSKSGGELKYIKLNSSMVVQEQVTVDSYDDVGSHLTINVGKDNSGNQVPYIGYYGRKHAKMAYRVNFGTDTASGSTEDKIYTHNWEITYVPTSDTINDSAENTVNVAVWTKAGGYLDVSPSGSNTSGTFNGNTTTAGDTVPAGNVYANGTNNPVVAYIGNSGSLDYAQIKGDSTEITFKTGE